MGAVLGLRCCLNHCWRKLHLNQKDVTGDMTSCFWWHPLNMGRELRKEQMSDNRILNLTIHRGEVTSKQPPLKPTGHFLWKIFSMLKESLQRGTPLFSPLTLLKRYLLLKCYLLHGCSQKFSNTGPQILHYQLCLDTSDSPFARRKLKLALILQCCRCWCICHSCILHAPIVVVIKIKYTL